MAVVIATNLRKELVGDVLFDGVSFKVERRDRLALSGPNGAGKTTLLRALMRETPLHGGELAFEKGTRVALHDQRPPLDTRLTLREYVLSGASDLVATEEELRRLERAMADGVGATRFSHLEGQEEEEQRRKLEATLRRYAEAQGRLEHAGGYDWRERTNAVIRGLGFADADLDRPLLSFSGGELTRASLARAMGGDPDLLLLDEPTNHLDVASLEWLEQELQSLDAGIVLVAHDRWFLEAVANAVLELEAGRSTYFAGPWHTWRLEKAARLQSASTASQRIGRDIERLERFVARFRASTKKKARQAQTKLTQIERLQKERAKSQGQIDLLTRRSRHLGFEFLKPARSGRTVVDAEDVTVRIGTRTLLTEATFAIERGEHVALVGPNGSGKTTLLETMLGKRHPTGSGIAEKPEGEGQIDAGVPGRIRLGHGVEPAYFSQQELELDAHATRLVSPNSRSDPRTRSPRKPRPALADTGSVLQCVQSMTGLQRPDAQKLLGRFLFSGWTEHEKPVAVLSGGERRRLALAVVVASGANFLVLDEPTNHLDLESREALEGALEAFPGTLLLVSHDRALVDAVAERTLAIENGMLRSYDGGWADYVRRRDELAAPPPVEVQPTPQPKQKAPKREPVKQSRPSELERIEAEIAHREEAVAELERALADDWSDVEKLAAHRLARDELRSLLELWEELFERSAKS